MVLANKAGGFGDWTTEQIDGQKTYLNCFTAEPSGVRRSPMPMVLPNEESCVKAARAVVK
jgi:hypothetical protein